MTERAEPRGPRSLSPERGQAAVEFTLTVVFLMLLVIGFLEIILLMQAYSVLADSAKEGVRFAIVHGTLSTTCNGPGDPANPKLACLTTAAGVKTAVTNYADHSGQNVTAGDVTVNYSPDGGTKCSAPGCQVQVLVAHQYRAFFGLGWPKVKLNAAAEGVVTF